MGKKVIFGQKWPKITKISSVGSIKVPLYCITCVVLLSGGEGGPPPVEVDSL